MPEVYILAGDVGGTNSRFMLYEVDCSMSVVAGQRAPGKLVFNKIYQNEGVTEFIMQVKKFFVDANCAHKVPVVGCIAVAGPVADNQVIMTNRAWVINGDSLAKELGMERVRLVNDFVAAGYGLLTLCTKTECVTLQAGKPVAGGVIACIGSGTGLGETFLTCPAGSAGGGDYDCFPSEGGHAELAPKDELQWELVQFLRKKFEGGPHHDKNHTRVSVERVVSGTGIVNVYDFLAQKYPQRVDSDVHAQIESTGDLKAKIIASKAHVPGSLCEQVMLMWASHYGSEAGVAGLKWIPYGGLFLAGGMTPKNIQWIQGCDSAFMKAFRDKGRVSPILTNVPIYAVLEEDIGQRGAHYVAFTMFKRLEDTVVPPTPPQLSIGKLTVAAALIGIVGVAVGRATK